MEATACAANQETLVLASPRQKCIALTVKAMVLTGIDPLAARFNGRNGGLKRIVTSTFHSPYAALWKPVFIPILYLVSVAVSGVDLTVEL